MVQEPWIHQDRICGLSLKGYKLYYAKGAGKIRSCILAKSSLNIFILSDYSNEDTVAVSWETNEGSLLWLISSYMAHDHGEHPPNDAVRSAVKMANRSKIPLVICADANSHHIIWGSSDTNTRGESLFNFILNSSLEVVNRGSEPTFIIANRSEVLDLTLVSAEHHSMITNWAVSSDCSFSDHQYIDFNISVTIRSVNNILNRRKTNWELQRDALSRSLPNPPSIENREDIEVAVETLTEAFQSATNLACRPTIRRVSKHSFSTKTPNSYEKLLAGCHKAANTTTITIFTTHNSKKSSQHNSIHQQHKETKQQNSPPH
ncbi:uncharacterized protein LOC135951613 [Calliphora vicina]|uniref:uncharacterized protein LOC135951613 n=1 Tax=Calliphora vicina TaxID=7373 RepID=UPI00325B0851